jgi:menaquinone-specific isochorismate synthase
LALVTAMPTTRLPVTVVSEAVDFCPDLLAELPRPTGALSFLRRGEGFVGWGVHEQFSTKGPDAAEQIQRWFAEVNAGLQVEDSVAAPGSGPVAFVSLGFDDDDVSVAVVPTTVVGSAHGKTFVTRLGAPGGRRERRVAITSPGRVSYSDAELSVAGFTSAVAAATARVRAGELDKVVLAHDLEATAARQVDERFILQRLANAYPDCWTFAVQGLLGASPELLIRRSGRTIASRVLAGTAWREHLGDEVSAELLSSAKDIAEHAYAVRSVADVLALACDELTVPASPVPLELANLTHLSTDIVGRLDERTPTALELAARLHPTAAVGGSPTGVARQVIRELEPMDRGRYAAPVGWIDSRGDGEFAIALRCAQVNGRNLRLMAGCGIVADSNPETEAREAQIKMIPIRDALEGR